MDEHIQEIAHDEPPAPVQALPSPAQLAEMVRRVEETQRQASLEFQALVDARAETAQPEQVQPETAQHEPHLPWLVIPPTQGARVLFVVRQSKEAGVGSLRSCGGMVLCGGGGGLASSCTPRNRARISAGVSLSTGSKEAACQVV